MARARNRAKRDVDEVQEAFWICSNGRAINISTQADNRLGRRDR